MCESYQNHLYIFFFSILLLIHRGNSVKKVLIDLKKIIFLLSKLFVICILYCSLSLDFLPTFCCVTKKKQCWCFQLWTQDRSSLTAFTPRPCARLWGWGSSMLGSYPLRFIYFCCCFCVCGCAHMWGNLSGLEESIASHGAGVTGIAESQTEVHCLSSTEVLNHGAIFPASSGLLRKGTWGLLSMKASTRKKQKV